MNKKTDILFVCSANKDRSKTAEDYFSRLYPELNFESCGTNLHLCQIKGTNPISETIVDRADIIYAMESKHKEQINSYTKAKHVKKIIVLGIQDRYLYYQKDLIELLFEKLDDQLKIVLSDKKKG